MLFSSRLPMAVSLMTGLGIDGAKCLLCMFQNRMGSNLAGMTPCEINAFHECLHISLKMHKVTAMCTRPLFERCSSSIGHSGKWESGVPGGAVYRSHCSVREALVLDAGGKHQRIPSFSECEWPMASFNTDTCCLLTRNSIKIKLSWIIHSMP